MGNVPGTSIEVKVRNGPTTVTVHVKQQLNRSKRLRFGNGNAKIAEGIYTFSLPAGHTCPFARECRSQAQRKSGRIKDGPNTLYRCYAASLECTRRAYRDHAWRNFDLLKGKSSDEMAELLLASLSPYAGWVRMHVGGDFFSLGYFDAWLDVARERTGTRFYGYTKSLPYWVTRRREVDKLDNFVLTASYGGTHDQLIAKHGLRFAWVVYDKESYDQAVEWGLDFDHDDTHAMVKGASFAQLLHGPQPAGSEAGRTLSRLRQAGEFGYGERADEIRLERGRVPLELLF